MRSRANSSGSRTSMRTALSVLSHWRTCAGEASAYAAAAGVGVGVGVVDVVDMDASLGEERARRRVAATGGPSLTLEAGIEQRVPNAGAKNSRGAGDAAEAAMSTGRRVGTCLAAGMVLSVGVAWLGAAYSERPGSAPATPVLASGGAVPKVPRDLAALRGLGVTVVEAGERTVASTWLVRREQRLVRVTTPGAAGPSGAWVDVYSAGWPAKALRWTDVPMHARELGDPAGATAREVWEMGIDCRGARRALPDSEGWRRLPVRAWWVGLMVNAAVWGAMSAVAFALPGIVRRQVRRGRGECGGCGYPVRDASGTVMAACPECGTLTGARGMPETGSPG